MIFNFRVVNDKVILVCIENVVLGINFYQKYESFENVYSKISVLNMNILFIFSVLSMNTLFILIFVLFVKGK
jgi:hypothetical protein